MKEGFTLIELLIVIAILTLLSTIAIQNLLKYKKNAVIANVQENLVGCMGQLCAEYADNGTTTKLCVIPDSNQTCMLVLNASEGIVTMETSYCDFTIKGLSIRCKILTSTGSTIGTIDCYPKP